MDLGCFVNWLVTISAETLSSIQVHPVNGFFSDNIKLIQHGMNLWDPASADEVAPSIHKAFLWELADYPSTQYANKMLPNLV
jgi:hypothetical protein